MKVSDMEWSVRTGNILENANLWTVSMDELLGAPDAVLLKARGCGNKTLKEIRSRCLEYKKKNNKTLEVHGLLSSYEIDGFRREFSRLEHTMRELTRTLEASRIRVETEINNLHAQQDNFLKETRDYIVGAVRSARDMLILDIEVSGNLRDAFNEKGKKDSNLPS